MTKKTGASTSRLTLLHELLVEQIIFEFEFYKAEGIPMSATDKQVALSLLKQEGITATPDNEDIQRLQEVAARIKDEAKKEVATSILAEVQEATDGIGAYLN
jgi:predicted Ser/Thr protein kinase